MSTVKIIYIIIFIIFLLDFIGSNKPCMPLKFNHSSIVCVCNSTYCDEIEPVKPLPKGQFVVYSSSMDGLRFKETYSYLNRYIVPSPIVQGDLYQIFTYITTQRRGDVILRVNRNIKYQKVFGFGASFTDSAGINYYKLSKNTKHNLLSSLYGKKGLEYNLARVPIGGSDFSTRPYTYNDFPEHDATLSNFSLSVEDFKYKIPMIKVAQRLARKDIFLMASCWTPPIWMKTSKSYHGPSRLLKKYYQLYADYHIKFLDEYSKQNISFWAITTGNEPTLGISMTVTLNSLGWTYYEQGLWIAENFGPTIRNSKYSRIKIFAIDDHRTTIPWAVDLLAENKKAFSYIDGIATHWYFDWILPVNLVNPIHQRYPEKMLFSTEASVGMFPWITEKVELGSWARAELYIKNIFEDFNTWYNAWIDWNMALSEQGGPNYMNNFIDATIIIPNGKDEFYKQPMLYAIGHFSKFVPRNSVRIHLQKITGDIDAIAFLRPDNGVVIIIFNKFNYKRTIIIKESGVGSMTITIPGRSFHTILYW